MSSSDDKTVLLPGAVTIIAGCYGYVLLEEEKRKKRRRAYARSRRLNLSSNNKKKHLNFSRKMEDQHAVTVKISKADKPLTTLQRNVNPTPIKEMITELQVIQKETNEFLTKLVEDEKQGSQNTDVKEAAEEEEDDDEEEDKSNGDVSILKRKLQEHVKDEKKLKT